MNHPQIIVILHGNIKILSGLGSLSNLADCTSNVEFRSHKAFIFILDFIDNSFGMNIRSIRIPLNLSKFRSTVVGSIVVIEEGG
jgi:hypothetical protein